MTKLFAKARLQKQHDYRNHSQGSITVHSSGTQGAQNYPRQLLVSNSQKTQNFLGRDLS